MPQCQGRLARRADIPVRSLSRMQTRLGLVARFRETRCCGQECPRAAKHILLPEDSKERALVSRRLGLIREPMVCLAILRVGGILPVTKAGPAWCRIREVCMN